MVPDDSVRQTVLDRLKAQQSTHLKNNQSNY
jgi:hypothetical protein